MSLSCGARCSTYKQHLHANVQQGRTLPVSRKSDPDDFALCSCRHTSHSGLSCFGLVPDPFLLQAFVPQALSQTGISSSTLYMTLLILR